MEGCTLKNSNSYKIQNGRLSAIIDFNMHIIWMTLPDSKTINIKYKLISYRPVADSEN